MQNMRLSVCSSMSTVARSPQLLSPYIVQYGTVHTVQYSTVQYSTVCSMVQSVHVPVLCSLLYCTPREQYTLLCTAESKCKH